LVDGVSCNVEFGHVNSSALAVAEKLKGKIKESVDESAFFDVLCVIRSYLMRLSKVIIS